LGSNQNQASLFIPHSLGKFLVTLEGSAHGTVQILQTLDVRRRVLPRLDGRRAFDGDVAPGVELDDRDGGSDRPVNVLNLHGVRAGPETEHTVQESGRG